MQDISNVVVTPWDIGIAKQYKKIDYSWAHCGLLDDLTFKMHEECCLR